MILCSIPGKEHLFEVVTVDRTFYVQVESEPDIKEWVRVLKDLLQIIKPTLQLHGQVQWLNHVGVFLCGGSNEFQHGD